MARFSALWIGACCSSKSLILVLFFGFVITLPGKSVLADGVCSERQFRCGNGHCIPLTWACEGEDDCGDNTDETAPRCKGLITHGRSERTKDRTKWLQTNPRPEGHFVGGLIETPTALRMVGLIKNLPLNVVSMWDFLSPTLRKERRKRDAAERKKDNNEEEDDTVMESPILGRKEATTAPTSRRKRPVKARPTSTPTTPTTTTAASPTVAPPATSTYSRPTPSSCCRQDYIDVEEMSESQLRRETARMNLNVLRRLASMLGAEEEKLSAERQMLSASRNMLLAETRKVISERGKIESEKQKVDLERDVLQSQVLSRGRRVAEGYR